jgi:hypothetical protein
MLGPSISWERFGSVLLVADDRSLGTAPIRVTASNYLRMLWGAAAEVRSGRTLGLQRLPGKARNRAESGRSLSPVRAKSAQARIHRRPSKPSRRTDWPSMATPLGPVSPKGEIWTTGKAARTIVVNDHTQNLELIAKFINSPARTPRKDWRSVRKRACVGAAAGQEEPHG